MTEPAGRRVAGRSPVAVPRLLAGTLSLLLLASMPWIPAGALTNGSVSFAPVPSSATVGSHYQYLVRPGATVSGLAVLANASGTSRTYDLYAADATAGRGSFSLRTRGSEMHGIGQWASFPDPIVTLLPLQHAMVSFTLHVPGDARAGGYVGGVVAVDATQTPGESTAPVIVQSAVALRVYVLVVRPTFQSPAHQHRLPVRDRPSGDDQVLRWSLTGATGLFAAVAVLFLVLARRRPRRRPPYTRTGGDQEVPTATGGMRPE